MNSENLSGYIAMGNIPMALCLFVGFIWIKNRARRMEAGEKGLRAVAGALVVAPAVLFLSRQWFASHLFDFPYWARAMAECSVIIAVFAVTGLYFLRRKVRGPALDNEGPILTRKER